MLLEKDYGNLEITPNPSWADTFWKNLEPLKDAIANHALFNEMTDGKLPIKKFRCALLNFYPLVANFPHYMGCILGNTSTLTEPGMLQARDWLIGNIKVEQRHLFWYRDWAKGFGISDEQLDHVVPPAAMDAINHFLWNTNRHAAPHQAIAATNLAIEWATGEWSKKVVHGMKRYAEQGVAHINKRSMAWLRAHAHYDDLHPYEAMELIKLLCADNEKMQQEALAAAKQGMEYYLLALDYCYQER